MEAMYLNLIELFIGLIKYSISSHLFMNSQRQWHREFITGWDWKKLGFSVKCFDQLDNSNTVGLSCIYLMAFQETAMIMLSDNALYQLSYNILLLV